MLNELQVMWTNACKTTVQVCNVFDNLRARQERLDAMTRELDSTDLRLIADLRRHPRASMAELARAARVARGTAYARLERLESEGVISGYGPDVEPNKAGLDVLAFCTLEISQGSHEETTAELIAIPQILEIHTVTGQGDLHCRIVARTNDHLHVVLQQIAAIPNVRRSQTSLALSTVLHRTIADVLTGA
jgi:DNA-binding Lrp family transcriptional regulator